MRDESFGKADDFLIVLFLDSNGGAFLRLHVWRYIVRRFHLHWSVTYQHEMVWVLRLVALQVGDSASRQSAEERGNCVAIRLIRRRDSLSIHEFAACNFGTGRPD